MSRHRRHGRALRREVRYALAVFAGRWSGPELMPLEEACWGVAAAEAVVESPCTGAPVAPA